MQTYQIDTPDGASYEVEAENDEQAQSTINSYLPSSGFDPEKAISNIPSDIGQMAVGLGANIKEGAYDMPKRALETGLQMASGTPYAQTPSGQQDTQLVANAPAQLAEIAKPVTHPLDYLQEHPVQQTLNALSLGELGLKGLGKALNAIPVTENIIPTLERTANNQTLKGFGGTMGQLKQMEASGGREGLDAAARYAREKGLSDVFTTDLGRENTLKGLLKQSGQTVGALRKEAGPVPNPKQLISQLIDNPKANMDQYLGSGMASGQLPMAEQAINDIQRIGGPNPTHADLANAASYINKEAAGSKLYQPVNAATDVANALSDINNQGIAQTLGSGKALQYVNALEEQQKLHPLEHLQARGELRQMGGRGGIGLQLFQKFADEIGYRASAKTIAALHDAMVSRGIPITKIAVANVLNSLTQRPSITDLIGQLKAKYDARRKM